MKLVKEHMFSVDTMGQCHASTVAECPKGVYVAAWFAGTKEGNRDVSIWTARKTEDGWSAPQKLPRLLDEPHWNPVLFYGNDNVLHLYYKIGNTISTWQTWHAVSNDAGMNWSIPAELVSGDYGGRGPVKNKPIILNDGSWLAPASMERNDKWEAFVDHSSDQGRTWTSFPVPVNWALYTNGGARGVIQPTIWESRPGNVHMLLRSTAGAIHRSDSVNSGRAWCPVYATGMPSNNSGLDVARRPADGLLALLCNPVSGNWSARSPLTLFLSRDNGETWQRELDSETGEGEFSYPAIISAANGDFIATYSWKRETICFARFINHS